MILPTRQFSFADSSDKPDAGAGRFFISGQPRVRIVPSPELLHELDETTAEILEKKPETLICAEPVLASIEVFWLEELRRIKQTALDPLAQQGLAIKAEDCKSQADFVLEFIVRGFPTREENSAKNRELLFGIFENVRRGSLDLFEPEPPPVQPPMPPRRWTLRWWKNFFRSCCCRWWAAGPASVVVSTSPVPPRPVNEPKPGCRCEICSPS